MGKTMRGEANRHEGTSSQCADRDDRLHRATRDAKRLERAERHTDIADADTTCWPLGSTVRAVS